MSSKTTEQLTTAIEHLRNWAVEKGVAWVPGTLGEDRGALPAVHFQRHNRLTLPVASAEALSGTLDKLDVAMLVVSIVTLDADTHKAAVALYEGEPDLQTGPDAREARAFVKGMLADARAAGEHIGKPGSVLVSAITRNPSVIIEWSAMADWYLPIEAAEMAWSDMEDFDAGSDPDDDEDGWEEIRPQPEPPVPPRRRISPRR